MKNKILIDIKHPAQLNLFKGLAVELQNDNWEVVICYLERGKLPRIINKEYHGFKTIAVGKSEGTKWSIFWDGNVKRTNTFVNLIRKEKFNICIAASSAPLALACRITGTPVIQFYDDPERKRINQINAYLSNQIFFPFVSKSSKVSGFNCLKEWSYLSPKRFKPSKDILEQYNLKERAYIFVREVSNKSFNYFGQDEGIICSMSAHLDNKLTFVLSLEDKSLISKFPPNWIILEEPVSDIHSLMYYSRMVISSGDSMAREGAMLGVPSIYCGFREMVANTTLINEGVLYHIFGEGSENKINNLIQQKFDSNKQIDFRNELLERWDDMIEFMKSEIERYSK